MPDTINNVNTGSSGRSVAKLPQNKQSGQLVERENSLNTNNEINLPYLRVKNIKAKSVNVVVYGIPEDAYTVNSAFGIKVNLGDYESLYRMFKIKDVGRLVPSTSGLLSFSFKFRSKKSEFNALITNVANYDIGDWNEIKFALIDEGSEMSFTNSYGDSFLEKLNNISSTMMSDFHQLGLRVPIIGSPQEFADKIGDMVTGALGFLGGTPLLGGIFEKMASSLRRVIGTGSFTSHILGADKAIFPKVWRGSSMSNNYNCRVLLTALSEDPKSIEERILVPMIILTILATPLSSDSFWFNYPFIIKCEIEGLRSIDAACITDLRFGFGTGSSFMSKDKKYISVEASFSVMDLFNVMVTPKDATSGQSIIPTTKKWFEYISKYVKG